MKKAVIVLGIALATASPFALAMIMMSPVDRYFCASTGDWNASGNWNTASDCSSGSTGVPATDDRITIKQDKTCSFNVASFQASQLTVETGANLNIEAGNQFQINLPTTGTSTLTGTIRLKGSGSTGSTLVVDNANLTFSGSGKLIGEHNAAEIRIGGNRTLTNESTIEGKLKIVDDSATLDGTFVNSATGIVHGNSGTLQVGCSIVDDAAGSLWRASAGGTLWWNLKDAAARTSLEGDFEVDGGTLDIDAKGFCTTGTLLMPSGVIDADVNGTASDSVFSEYPSECQ